MNKHVRNITLDIILTILTCFLYNIYIQHKQMEALNDMLGTKKYDFLSWLLLTIVTCGIYHVYHEYRMSDDLARMVPGASTMEPIISIVLAIAGLHIITDAIQQSHINRHYGNNEL